MPNSCQGTQNGPCPYACCDKSVKFSIYDLVLCPDCMHARENYHSSLANERVGKAAIPAMPPKKGRKVKTASTAANIDQQPFNDSNNTTVGTTSQPTTSMATVDDICSRGDHDQDAGQQKLCTVSTDEIPVFR